jgi:hypothetical protein
MIYVNVVEYWNSVKEKGCECKPYSSASSVPPTCPIHCSCMKNGREIPNSKKIDGTCKICGNYPLDWDDAHQKLLSYWEDQI